MRVKESFRQIGIGLSELLFPPQELCPVCQREPSCRHGLGKNCLRRIGFVEPPLCHKCGRPRRLETLQDNICRQCATTQYYFNQARAVAIYEGALREYLAEIKYRYRPELGSALGELFVDWVKLNPRYQKTDLIIPTPIHYMKLAVRGYNQAELIAKPLNKFLGICAKQDIIVRERVTESQNSLNREERFANISGAFRVNDASVLRGARVLLVDDILTTGATASEVSRVLLRAGALEVNVLTLAVGLIDSEWITI